MDIRILQLSEACTAGHHNRGKFVAVFLLFIQASCGGEQPQPIIDDSAYLKFVAIAPGRQSEFDELYALVGDYSSPNVIIRPERVPVSVTGKVEKKDHVQRLRLFHINDLHHHLSDKVGNLTEYRAARISKLIADGRRLSPEDEAVLFVSAGDDAAGTRFDELIGYDPSEFIMHLGYETYSSIGMDVAVLGNHEFDWGTELLELSVVKSASFPVISSNVWSGHDGWPVHGSLIGTINGYRIAFLGFTPPDALPVQSLEGRGYRVLDISDQLAKLIPALDPYVDLYVLVNHIGFYAEVISNDAAVTSVPGDIAVARQLSGLTSKPAIVVGGHTHTILNRDKLEPANLINNIPILQAGEFGQWLGDASVILTKSEHGIAASYSAHLIDIDANSGQQSVHTLIDTALQETLLEPMEDMLQERFSTVISDAVDDPSLSAKDTALDRYSDESSMLNILTDALITNSGGWAEGQLDFAAINATSVSGGLNVGADVIYGDVFALMPYADTVFLLNVSGQQLKEIIENNAGRIRQKAEFIPHGGELDPSQFHGRGFLQFSAGIRYVIDTDSVTGRAVARNIYLNGAPVESVLSQQFTLAIPRFVASGRGGWDGDSGGSKAVDMRALVADSGYDTGRVWRNELLAYFEMHGKEISDKSREFKDHRVRRVN